MVVPFEENEKDPTIWYLDHDFQDNMSELYKKVNAKEKPVGWYHSGPKLRPSDLTIHELFRSSKTPSPVLLVIDPMAPMQPNSGKENELPVKAYMAVEEVRAASGISSEGAMGSSTAGRTFVNVNCAIEAEEAEQVGVEHLLRNVPESSLHSKGLGPLGRSIQNKLQSLVTLDRQIGELSTYVEQVLDGKLPPNQTILAAIQQMLMNMMPDMHGAESALTLQTNSQMAMLQVSSLARSLIALHELVNNKIVTAN